MVVKATLDDGGSGARATAKKPGRGVEAAGGGISHKEEYHVRIDIF